MSDKKQITDEMVKEFLKSEVFFKASEQQVIKRWDEYKASHSSSEKVDWEVIKLEHKGAISFLSTGRGYTLEEIQKDGWSIYSVRRLSDKTEWTIGEDTPKGKILKFEFAHPEGNMYVHYDLGGWDYLNEAKKVPIPEEKPVLFTTEDGKEIFEGDTYWAVDGDWEIQMFQAMKIAPAFHTYGERAKAEEYKTMNMPCLSASEVIEIWKEDNYFPAVVKQLASSKIKGGDGI